MSTITDVAQAAGVSVATVSRALRGLDRVSEATRARVLEVATALNYVASPTATSLASGRTRVVAVATPFLSRWFFSSLVSAIEKTLRSRGHHVLLYDLEEETYDRRRRLTQSMLWKRVDGLISLNLPLDEEELDLVSGLEMPLVSIGSRIQGRPCVRIDDREAIALATTHLISLGHQRIAYVGVVPENVAHVQTPQARLESFEATLRAHGLEPSEQWYLASDWTADAAARDAAPMLSGPERPTAVVAASDEMAFGILQAARTLGLDVPGDLSVIGVDDHSLSAVLGLTTVRQDVLEQGHRASQILLGMLLDGVPSEESVTEIPVELVVRESTGPVPA